MSLLDYRPSVRSPDVELVEVSEFEEAFDAWAHDPSKPEFVQVGQDRVIPMVELLGHLGGSRTTLAASAGAQLGLPPGVTIAAAVEELLHATVDPDGPRCRSLRAAAYYLRGLARLDADLQPVSGQLRFGTEGWRGDHDVR